MKRLDEFRIFYNHTIFPELMRLERRRRRLLWLLFLSGVAVTGLVFFELYVNILPLTLALSIPIGFYIGYLLYRIRQFILNFKPKVTNLILDFIDNDINYGTLFYDSKKFISVEDFKASNIFRSRTDLYQGEDYIKGSIGEIQFELSELEVREFSQVRRRLNYVFRGVFLKAEARVSLEGSLLILPKEFEQYLSRTLKFMFSQKGEKIDNLIRNKAFRDHFMTLATKETRIRNVLTEHLQQAIVDYRVKTDKQIYLSFSNRFIYIAVTEPKNLLEPYIWRSNVSFELVREFFQDLQLLLQIIEEIDEND